MLSFHHHHHHLLDSDTHDPGLSHFTLTSLKLGKHSSQKPHADKHLKWVFMYKVICVGTPSGPTAPVYLCLCHMDMMLQIVSCWETQKVQDHQTCQEQILLPIITFSVQREIMHFFFFKKKRSLKCSDVAELHAVISSNTNAGTVCTILSVSTTY